MSCQNEAIIYFSIVVPPRSVARRRFGEARKRLEHETVDTYFDSGLPLDKASLNARIVPSDAPEASSPRMASLLSLINICSRQSPQFAIGGLAALPSMVLLGSVHKQTQWRLHVRFFVHQKEVISYYDRMAREAK